MNVPSLFHSGYLCVCVCLSLSLAVFVCKCTELIQNTSMLSTHWLSASRTYKNWHFPGQNETTSSARRMVMSFCRYSIQTKPLVLDLAKSHWNLQVKEPWNALDFENVKWCARLKNGPFAELSWSNAVELSWKVVVRISPVSTSVPSSSLKKTFQTHRHSPRSTIETRPL